MSCTRDLEISSLQLESSEIKIDMTELEKRQVNRIILVDDQSMTKFLDNINKIRNKVTLLQYSETFTHIGKRIRIIDGPLASFTGKVKSIDKDNLKLTAVVEMFGREQDVDLSFAQIRVANN